MIAALNLTVAAFGVGWLLMGILVYAAYRRRQPGLRRRSEVAIPKPVVDHEAEYDSVADSVLDGRYDEHVLATAIKLAARKREGIHVVSLVTVPSALPLSAPMEEEEGTGPVGVIEQARCRAGAEYRVTGSGSAPDRRKADHRGGERHARSGDRRRCRRGLRAAPCSRR